MIWKVLKFLLGPLEVYVKVQGDLVEVKISYAGKMIVDREFDYIPDADQSQRFKVGVK